MKISLRNCGLALCLSFGVIAHSIAASSASGEGAPPVQRLTGENYKNNQATKGVVLFAVRWDRRWKCGEFENAQLQGLAFDKIPSAKTEDDEADLTVADAPLLMTKAAFENYAYLVEPGEYALSGFQVKVARSITDIHTLSGSRSLLIKDGKPEGGSFTVSAGEIVYIGHFYLDCYRQPIPWRFYAQGRKSFDMFLEDIHKAYPMLDVKNAQFRLFNTKEFGEPYQLPGE